MARDTHDVLDRIDREKDRYLEELEEYLRIPSISTDPDYEDDVLRAAEYLSGRMREAGLATELVDNGGHPMVYAERSDVPGAPTVLFYGHYDVQPADPLEEWRHEPFEPAREGDDLVARGATDDKGQSYTHVKAVGAMLAERGSLPVNVKFLVEGEEESGGESIERFVREDGGDKLACDCVVVSDTSMLGPGRPSLIYGLRGMAYTEITVRGPNRDLHSGTYGGAVQNPLNALCHIVASLRDPETGRVLVPGFYDDVRELEAWEREEMASLPHDDAEYARDIGISEVAGEEGYTTRERTSARPTCDVNGIFGGYMGKGAKTIIPARGGAKVSMRLVPDQEPGKVVELLRRHVESVAPRGVEVEVASVHGAAATLIETEGPILDAAMDALEEIWGTRPVKVREGGSIPIVATFADVLEVPVLLMGFGLPDDRLHSPNEKFNVRHFDRGIRSIARFLDRLGEVEPSRP